jgi:GNAT superfamily N-acetyltransferase
VDDVTTAKRVNTREKTPKATHRRATVQKPASPRAKGGRKQRAKLDFLPLTHDRWSDFEKLFGARGACGGCWCMWWRLTRSEFELNKGDANRRAMKAIVRSGTVPGILAYDGDEPVGWCSVAPRGDFSALARSRILKPLDDKPVWSVVCFFIKKERRGSGVSTALLRAAVDYVREKDGVIVEGYPVEPKTDRMPDAFAWFGLVSAFRKAGFAECARRSETRPIMRYRVRAKRR